MSATRFLLPVFLLVSVVRVCGQPIYTVAGTGSFGFSGDGDSAIYANLFDPERTVPDKHGNLYIADHGNSRIRTISATGIISTFAGNGSTTHSGDGGPAISAGITFPFSLARDAAGNTYIAENATFSGQGIGGAWVRKINTAGIISTIAGNGGSGTSGDGGPALAASFHHLTDIATDNSGNIYVVDNLDNRVRVINSAGIISTFAGRGTANFSGDGGPADSAELNAPYGVAIDKIGNVYIADALNSCIRIVNPAGIIHTFAGNGIAGTSGDGDTATNAELYEPVGVSVDGVGNVYIADIAARSIRKVDTSTLIHLVAGTGAPGFAGDGGAATAAELDVPYGVSVDDSGRIFIADPGNEDVRVVIPADTVLYVPATIRALPAFDLWPQPANGYFYVRLQSSTYGLVPCFITDEGGEVLRTLFLSPGTDQKVAPNLMPGIYVCTVIFPEGPVSRLFVVD